METDRLIKIKSILDNSLQDENIGYTDLIDDSENKLIYKIYLK